MTVRDAIKNLKTANKLLKSLGKQEMCLYIEVNDILHSNIPNIKKFLKEYLQDELHEEFLNHEFNNMQEFELKYVWYDGYVNKFKLKVIIW